MGIIRQIRFIVAHCRKNIKIKHITHSFIQTESHDLKAIRAFLTRELRKQVTGCSGAQIMQIRGRSSVNLNSAALRAHTSFDISRTCYATECCTKNGTVSPIREL